VNTAGVNKMKLYSTGQQLELRGKAETHRDRTRRSSDEEDI
jgi:hypothetical protein